MNRALPAQPTPPALTECCLGSDRLLRWLTEMEVTSPTILGDIVPPSHHSVKAKPPEAVAHQLQMFCSGIRKYLFPNLTGVPCGESLSDCAESEYYCVPRTLDKVTLQEIKRLALSNSLTFKSNAVVVASLNQLVIRHRMGAEPTHSSWNNYNTLCTVLILPLLYKGASGHAPTQSTAEGTISTIPGERTGKSPLATAGFQAQVQRHNQKHGPRVHFPHPWSVFLI